MKTLYYSFFYSHLQYGILLFGKSTYAYSIDRLRILQKKAIRLVKNVNYNSHTQPIFKELSILNIDSIIDIELMKFMYKYDNNMLPVTLNNLLIRSNEIHNYETRNADVPLTVKTHFAPLSDSFLVAGPNIWKKVTKDDRNIENIGNFIAKMKKQIIVSY